MEMIRRISSAKIVDSHLARLDKSFMRIIAYHCDEFNYSQSVTEYYEGTFRTTIMIC